MLRIDKNHVGRSTVLQLSGRIQSQDVPALRQQVGHLGNSLIVDLREVQLVDESAVRFLAECESKGIVLRHCAQYIREWIRREIESP
jgi:anti-anti-sigma regulatory factor